MLKVKKLSRNRLTCLRKIKQVAVVSSGEKPPQGRGKYDLVWSGLQLQKWWLAGGMLQLRTF